MPRVHIPSIRPRSAIRPGDSTRTRLRMPVLFTYRQMQRDGRHLRVHVVRLPVILRRPDGGEQQADDLDARVDEEQHEQEEDRAEAAPQGEGAAVIKGGLEWRRRELDLRRQVRSERRNQRGQSLSKRGARGRCNECDEKLALEHRGRRRDDDGRELGLLVN